MKKLLLIFYLVSQIAHAQTLYPSEHDTPAGKAEINSFMVHCEDDCFFTMFLKVQRLDFESPNESGAMYRVWNKSRDEFVLFGIDANKDKKEPQLSIFSSINGKKHILGFSKLGELEGFRFEWNAGIFELRNFRRVSHEGYSQIEESGLTFKGDLGFEPYSIEYLFLGAKLTQYVDTTSQNINPEWKNTGSGS